MRHHLARTAALPMGHGTENAVLWHLGNPFNKGKAAQNGRKPLAVALTASPTTQTPPTWAKYVTPRLVMGVGHVALLEGDRRVQLVKAACLTASSSLRPAHLYRSSTLQAFPEPLQSHPSLAPKSPQPTAARSKFKQQFNLEVAPWSTRS